VKIISQIQTTNNENKSTKESNSVIAILFPKCIFWTNNQNAVTNTGISNVTGNVGTNSGSSTGFGNVNGVMNDSNGVTGQCAADLNTAYSQLQNATPTFFPSSLLGNGQILLSGVYAISEAATLNSQLILNAQGNQNAVWIFQIDGAFASAANAEVVLLNGAQACNVFLEN
jgi:Ice-binding-like